MAARERFVVDGCVVRCIGEIDLATAPALREAIGRALESGSELVVDLAATTFLDSVGMSVLVQAARKAERAGGRLVVAGAHGLVRRVLDISGLDQVIPLFASVAEAEASNAE